jgi:hypothetical protein
MTIHFSKYGDWTEHQLELRGDYLSLRTPALLQWDAWQELRLSEGQEQALAAAEQAFEGLTSQMRAIKAKLEAEGVVVGREPWDR